MIQLSLLNLTWLALNDTHTHARAPTPTQIKTKNFLVPLEGTESTQKSEQEPAASSTLENKTKDQP